MTGREKRAHIQNGLLRGEYVHQEERSGDVDDVTTGIIDKLANPDAKQTYIGSDRGAA